MHLNHVDQYVISYCMLMLMTYNYHKTELSPAKYVTDHIKKGQTMMLVVMKKQEPKRTEDSDHFLLFSYTFSRIIVGIS